jgi:hypothetical protein
MSYNVIVRVCVVILAIISAYVFFTYLFQPYVLDKMCLTNTNRCVRMTYQNYENSALIQMEPDGVNIWFNGMNGYVFTPDTGRVCDKDTQPAYLLDPTTGMPKEYLCITTIDKLSKFYDGRGIDKKYIYKRVEDPTKFSAYDVLNLFAERGILNLVNISTKTVLTL